MQRLRARERRKGGFGRLLLLLIGAFLPLAIRVPAQERPTPSAFTQRRINELAAALEQARRALNEETRLRQPGEKLPDYLRRLAAPLPAETPARYRARLERYLAALTQAATVTTMLQNVPSLHLDTPENRQTWDRAVRALKPLPLRLARVRAAWQRAESHPEKAATAELGSELTQTYQHVQTALDALRDARP